jgi:hypothetical protein
VIVAVADIEPCTARPDEARHVRYVERSVR